MVHATQKILITIHVSLWLMCTDMYAEYVPLPGGANGYDIALLKLVHALTFNNNVKVALPRTLPNPDIGTELFVAGWGRTTVPGDARSSSTRRLKWVNEKYTF